MQIDPLAATPAQIAALEEDHRALKELLASRGWQIVSDALCADLLRAALSLSENPRLDGAELHHRRGTLFAAKALAELPATLLRNLESQVSLAQASAPLRPGNKE